MPSMTTVSYLAGGLGSGPGERQLNLEHLLIDFGNVIHLVDPYLASGP